MNKALNRLSGWIAAAAAALLMCGALVCAAPAQQAYAEEMSNTGSVTAPASVSDDTIIGNLAIVANYHEGEMLTDGHCFLVFTSYVDDLTLSFTDLYGYYTLSDEFKQAIYEDSNNLSGKYAPMEEGKTYLIEHLGDLDDVEDTRYRTAAVDYDLNAGEFVTVGNYVMLDTTDAMEEAEAMVEDALMNSDLIEDLKVDLLIYMIKGYTVDELVDTLEGYLEQYIEGEIDSDTLKAKTQEYLVKTVGEKGCQAVIDDYLSKRGMYDGDTGGGLFVNRELSRQKSWQDFSSNQVCSVDINRTQLEYLMEYLNGGDANHYSVAVHNCTSMAVDGWNAAVGYEWDDMEYQKTDYKSALYLDAGDETFELIEGLIDTPKKVYETIQGWREDGIVNGATNTTWPIIAGVKMPAGWNKCGTALTWYYWNEAGKRVTGWTHGGYSDGRYYYMGTDGAMVTDAWQKTNGYWYYLTSSGKMAASQWINYNGSWYYMVSSGRMTTGQWTQSKGYWYYLNTNGKMAANQWLKYKGYWYYLTGNGKMAANTTMKINGKSYTFSASGKML